MRTFLLLSLACGLAFAGTGGGPASYVVGNLDQLSPGVEGTLVLEDSQAVFRSGKAVLSIPYADIGNVALGTKSAPPSDIPLYKVWELHKRFLVEHPMHQMLVFEFTAKDGTRQNMTLEMEESAAAETLNEIEIRQGKRTPPRRATNADSWWGDSLWKTTRNNNTVSPEAVGNSPKQ
jgi:hypothetical protein